ncbi:arginine--tRNA ligase [Arcobacter cryaerophilus gv. pseudocryaerophilus]|uniref:Arginine--tRNA ligase n=3 Tax=unclassified Arcobacter TaxID=2593671 RepID=A0AA96L4F1_9BACT|nr:arginine--tRNA ligase [Arcobacter sp. AZ-2023]WPD05648.1 arginine--tRNA ligase [Arcobacter sp. DSM 115956]WPD07740.1 arginine--tRNA ligase [Arcobacter sp. DSM 115955]WNL32005.1 arginine--tRNA ligase [Arcobacter sp. AZ-2023]WNP38155.1 arginine--tRNA ligase [Arcobacter sp. AZ-2023]
MQNIVKEFIEKKLEKSIVLEKPKDSSLGHFATPVAFSLAKELKKSPMILADELVLKLENSELFEKIEAVKGFINFTLSKSFIEKLTNEALEKKDDFAKGDKKDEKILLEYVSANPTGPLHIGHARGAVFGDTLYKVGIYLGYDITTEYYINDAGAQMQLLGISVSLAARDFIFKEKVKYPESYYRGEYLIEIAEKIIEKHGKDIIYDESRFEEMAIFAKDIVMQIIIKDLGDLGINFQNFVSEKSLYSSWENTKSVLEKNGSLYTKDEKIYLSSTKFGDDSDRVVVRENGIPTYLAGDIIYHKNKFDREFDKYINIWGADHHGYITRVKAAIEFLGNDSSKLEVILSQMVQLLKGGQPYKMSKRAGNVILMSDITSEIGSDALRFIFLTKKSDTHLEFDIDMLKNQDSSNPIFYINYAHARINQVFVKSNLSFEDIKNESFEALNSEALNLVYESLLLKSILEDAFSKRDMQKITEYLYNLASSVHKFYNEHKIIGSSEEKIYLKVLSMAKLSIKTGLKLLGIEAKEIM